MKKLICALTLSVSAVVSAAPVVSDVIVRQQWPWNTSVNVDFIVSGTTGGVSQVSLKAYRGEILLGDIPTTALSGDVLIRADGAKRVLFNPADVPVLSGQSTMGDFRVDVSVSGSEDFLYAIFDLTKNAGEQGALTFVTEEALTNGAWGAWQRGPCGMLPDSVIWTGVTADDRYKTTHLVMRRIPAGSFSYGEAADATYRDTSSITSKVVMITKPYYIGVFELTGAQKAIILNKSSSSTDKKPAENVYWNYPGTSAMRGYGAEATLANWPTVKTISSNSLMGQLRSRTGCATFDLPTEAQWEKAARAGSSGPYYHTNAETLNASSISPYAWYQGNYGSGSLKDVGQKLPNDYGLYDALGNVEECVLDWGVKGYIPDDEDPEGPVAAGADLANKRVLRGGRVWLELGKIRLGFRTFGTCTSNQNQGGLRVCCAAF